MVMKRQTQTASAGETATELPPLLQLSAGQRWWRAAISLVMASGLLLLRFLNPAESTFSLTTPLTQRLFGLPCPFCGITRGTHALLNGEVMRSLYLNMATVLVVAVAVLLMVMWTVEAARGRAVVSFSRWVDSMLKRWKWLLAGLFVFWMIHLSVALWLPKPELLNRDAWLFPEFLLQRK